MQKYNIIFFMDKQKIIIIISSIVVVSGAAFAYWYFQKSSEAPLFRTQDGVSKSTNEYKEPCVITVRGDKYDVTEFRNKHKGGNIFKCGEDMTDAFNKQHGEKQLKELQKYKL
jgi:hypothetical protein